VTKIGKAVEGPAMAAVARLVWMVSFRRQQDGRWLIAIEE